MEPGQNVCLYCGKPCTDDRALCEKCEAYTEPCCICGEWDHRDNMVRWVNENGFVEWYHVDCFEPEPGPDSFDGDQIEYSESF